MSGVRDYLTGGLLSIAVMLLLAVGSSAQQVQGIRGTVTDAGTGAPVSAALVAVVGPDGSRGASVLTGGDGRYALEVASPGTMTRWLPFGGVA